MTRRSIEDLNKITVGTEKLHSLIGRALMHGLLLMRFCRDMRLVLLYVYTLFYGTYSMIGNFSKQQATRAGTIWLCSCLRATQSSKQSDQKDDAIQ